MSEYPDFIKGGKKLANELIAFRRELHRFPELSLHEVETSARVAERISGLGLSIKEGVGGYGVVADLPGKHPGPTIALRADMDALPIQEETELPFASERPGVMHACGHDAHTAILIGALKLLCESRDFLKGNVRFIFQPAEEITAGAKAMIEEGVLEGVDEIYGLHNMPFLPTGKVGTRYDSMMGSIDRLEIVLEGKGGHAAKPDSCVDALVGASAVVMALQTIVSREISPFESAVVTIGTIQGSGSHNVISQYARMSGTIRAFSQQARKQMIERIPIMVHQIAEGYRCKAEINIIEKVPVLVNHNQNIDYVNYTVKQLIGHENLVNGHPTLGGEDFSLYLNRVPGCYFWLGSGPANHAEYAFAQHHPKFTVNEECIPLGASILASIAFNRLKEIAN